VTLAIDASSPAVAVNGASSSPLTATTASFTPPANSLLVVLASGDNNSVNSTGTFSVTDNLGAHLTYTQRVFASNTDSPAAGSQAIIYTAPVTSSAPMTVSVTHTDNGGGGDLAAQVVVVTDGGNLPTVGTNAKQAFTSGSVASCSYTATATGSWGFAAVADWSAGGTMTAGTGCTTIGTPGTNPGLMSYGFVRRTTADGVSGASTTLTANLAAASTAYHIAAVEVVGSGGGAASLPILAALYIGPTRR
jgi:hypothetical protein